MPRVKYGTQSTCRVCSQDISYSGNREWRDRGGNRECVPYRDRENEIVRPPAGTKHKPHNN